MKKTPINPISNKQSKELMLRRKIKAELMNEQLRVNGYIFCMTCSKKPDWRGISLSHIIPLSRGGKTERGNVILECFACHNNKRHGLREV